MDIKLVKTLLCHNIIKNSQCIYNDKCIYAHNLDEQKKEPIRERAYKLLSDNDLSSINLNNDKELYDTLVLFTSVCNKCIINMCPGGYNCKYGVVDYKYKICRNDLIKGICTNNKCKLIHLTIRGLQPLFKIKNIASDTNSSSDSIELSYSSDDCEHSIFTCKNNNILIK